MKEFIDKLIERLEKEKSEAVASIVIWAYSKVIRIVNELAEEYKVSEMPTGWIPCSERLPEEKEQERTVYDPITLAEVDIERYMASDLVNVTVRNWDSDEVFACDDCTVDGKWVNFNGEQYEVIAWMPLPAPFKEGE